MTPCTVSQAIGTWMDIAKFIVIFAGTISVTLICVGLLIKLGRKFDIID